MLLPNNSETTKRKWKKLILYLIKFNKTGKIGKTCTHVKSIEIAKFSSISEFIGHGRFKKILKFNENLKLINDTVERAIALIGEFNEEFIISYRIYAMVDGRKYPETTRETLEKKKSNKFTSHFCSDYKLVNF